MMKPVVVVVLVLIVVGEAATTWDDTGKGSWTPTNSESQTILGVVEWTAARGTTTSAGLADGTQSLHVFTLPRSVVAAGRAKLVVWAPIATDNMHYKRAPLADIAADYEHTHPGWRVATGINADQYYPIYGGNRAADGSWWFVPSSYYPAIMDGQSRFSVTPYSGTDGFVAFSNDGNPDSIVINPKFSGFRVEVFDAAGSLVALLPVSHFNAAPLSASETIVWAAYMSTTNSSAVVEQSFVATGTNSTVYVVENAKLSYMMNSAAYDNGKDAFFGVGVVSKVVVRGTVGKGQFAIQTSQAVKVGHTVVAQAFYADDRVNKMESASGFHTIHRIAGKDQTSTASYNTNRYSRSIFGRTADGSYVLIAADHKNGLSGLNFFESNAALKHYGLYDAFQDDGGGSVTAIIGFGNSTFATVNHPSDPTGPRSVLDGLFFVVKT